MSLPSAPTLEDYEAIAEAVMETERGRWFLQQFARRNRSADTAQILDALARFEDRMRPPPQAPADVRGLADAVADVRAALTAPTTPERRVALSLDRLDALELLVFGAPHGSDAAPPLMLSAPAEPAPKPDLRPTDEPKAAVQPAIPSAWTRASFEAAAGKNLDASRRPPEPAAAPAPRTQSPEPPPRRQPPLLESLSEAEKALLFA